MTLDPNIEEIEKKMQYLVSTSGGADSLSAASFDYDHRNTKELINFHEGFNDVITLDNDGMWKGGPGIKLRPDLYDKGLLEYKDHKINPVTGKEWELGDSVSVDLGDAWFDRAWETNKIDVNKIFKNFNDFPHSTQAGLISMAHILGYNKFTSEFKNLIKEANKPNYNLKKMALEMKYAYPDSVQNVETQSKFYNQIGHRGEHLFQLIGNQKTVDDILKLYR